MLYNEIDNLLIKACKRAKLIRIRTARDVVLCEGFIKVDRGCLVFETVYSFNDKKTMERIGIHIDNIVDIEFSF